MADSSRTQTAVATATTQHDELTRKSTGGRLPACVLTNDRKRGIVALVEIDCYTLNAVARMTKVPEHQILEVLREHYRLSALRMPPARAIAARRSA